MAYDAGYQQQPQRQFNGPGAPRPPTQRQYLPGPGGPQQYNAPGPVPQQQYDQYQENYDYGYDEYGNGGGYQDQGGHGGQRDDMNYMQGPPPRQQNWQQDQYGPGPGRGRPMPGPGGRGGPQRAMTADPPGQHPPRGGQPPGRGRGGPGGLPGRPGPYERSGSSDPGMNRGPGQPPISPPAGGFGGSPFPTFPGQGRKSDRDEEREILNQMENMNISSGRGGPASGRRPGPPNGQGPNRGPMGPPQRPYPMQQNFPGPRRGPGPNQGYGPPDENFGPPGRTMTMPTMDPGRVDPGMHQPPPPMRSVTAQYGPNPMGQGVPPRPSTSQGMRQGPPPPIPNGGGQYQNGYGGGAPDQEGNQQQQPQRPVSFDDFYDNYYDSGNNESPAQNPPSAISSIPDFDAAPSQGPRNSFDQSMQAGSQEQAQRGPNRYPELSRTKSQPDLRQPQQAVFEMAGDVPSMPTQYQQGPGPRSDLQGGPGGYGQQTSGPGYQNGQGPPGPGYQNGQQPPGPGFQNGPAPARHGSGASSQSSHNPDGLPSHPTPVRPGLMPNSVASQMVNKPPPVRNYGNAGGVVAPAGTMSSSPAQMQQQQAPMPQNAQLDPPVSPELLERLRGAIKADPNDQTSALTLAKKLIEATDVLVPTIPDPRSRGKARERYVTDAHKILKKLSSAQNVDAMFLLADCLGRGAFTPEPDHKEAFTLYQSAAKLNHAAAAYRTAVCCEIGHDEGGGTRKDPLKAIQWYKRAATLGDTPAMYKVGMIMLKGLLGQPRNPQEAVSWLKRAAERADAENPHALHELGLLYESAQPNDRIIRDEAYAFSLFKQAADLGYKFSQYRLGCAWEYGLMGCPVDPRQSIMWYSKAATQEEHQSELALSGWYLTGSDGILQQSDTEAYLWARKAALAGLAKAEYAMGYFTEVGIGVPANMEDAKRWYWRAAAQDFPKARERLEDLKRSGKNGPRPRERISRSKMERQQEGDCTVM